MKTCLTENITPICGCCRRDFGGICYIEQFRVMFLDSPMLNYVHKYYDDIPHLNIAMKLYPDIGWVRKYQKMRLLK